MMVSDRPTPVEQQLLEQLAQLEGQIAELNQERTALQRLIMKVRRQNIAPQDVTRKNSFDRILVEAAILNLLREANAAISTRRLFEHAKQTNYKLSSGTFRSYLHRLKERGLITQMSRGFWKIA